MPLEFKPRRLSETNIQAEIYRQCKANGIECFLEYRSYWNGIRGCRFDAVIVKDGMITTIIEVKSVRPHRLEQRRESWKVSKQHKRYSQFGLPVYLVRCMDDVPPLISSLKTVGGI
jgi:hypothetical protein